MDLDTNALVLGFRAFCKGWEEEARKQIKRAIAKGKKAESRLTHTRLVRNNTNYGA